MPHVFNAGKLEFQPRNAKLALYDWRTSQRLHEVVGSKRISKMDVRSLDPGKYSFPYHFHRGAEELFVVFSGQATLRTPKGLQPLGPGDIVFLEEGPAGAHQLHNHGPAPFVYLDVTVGLGPDVVEYPDSGKIGTDGKYFQAGSAVDYFEGEADVDQVWRGLGRAPRP